MVSGSLKEVSFAVISFMNLAARGGQPLEPAWLVSKDFWSEVCARSQEVRNDTIAEE